MKINTLLLLFTGIILTSCFDTPNFPEKPGISFKDVIFKKIGGNSDFDSLIVRLDFEDGDGDLGLGQTERTFPYNLKNYYSKKTGQLFNPNVDVLGDLITLEDRASIDSLPPYSGDFQCLNWTTDEIKFSDTMTIKDTVYFQFNERHYNVLVDYFIKENGAFKKFDVRLLDCSETFYGRFPILNDKADKNGGLEGTLRYSMVSTGFVDFFGNKTLKLRIRIIDRAGNYSNAVETKEFTLNEIQVN